MTKRLDRSNLQVAETLVDFIEKEALPNTNINAEHFWNKFEAILNKFAPQNKKLLQIRSDMKNQIDEFYKKHSGKTINQDEYIGFLKEINYAANARWGSLYDALYGTDAISEKDNANKTSSYNPTRGKKVVNYAKNFLDKNFPLTNGSHNDVVSYKIVDNALIMTLSNSSTTEFKNINQYVGYQGDIETPNCTVDAEDKVLAYRNWLGLMKGDLEDTFEKNGNILTRKLNEDKSYNTSKGQYKLPGRSVMLIRNVGHLMTNPAILLKNGEEVPEGIMDAMITSLIAIHDIKFKKMNSRSGSIYIVKPKMHGPDEVKFACNIFSEVEDALELNKNTLKIGIMDEERRTTVNLKECIRAAKERTVFINTGFLDRTGDEIHTAMEAGPIIPKGEIKNANWISAYENNNVKIGLECGLSGKAQIGKGMWAMPDLMDEMLKQKINHPKSGANTAWVPSPTAATLHALHYHEINVFDIQKEKSSDKNNYLEDILDVPVSKGHNWSSEDIQKEMDNNAQGILGYVVRWVDQGVGCSKVPDINNIGLMEDRATCRISSQHLANWMRHGIFSKEQLIETMKKMARIVDKQNENDPSYKSMSDNFEHSIAFKASVDLVIEGTVSPSGYTEPILHRRRIQLKAMPD